MGNQFKNVAVIACLKTFLFIFNIVFWITGLLLLIVGLWAEFDLSKYMELSLEFSGTAPHVLIGLAVLIILVSSVAFSCIIKGQPVLLYIVSYIVGGFAGECDLCLVNGNVARILGHCAARINTTNPISTTMLAVFVSPVAFSCIIKGQPYGGFLACIFMMDAGVGASVACYRDTFAKGLHDGLTATLASSDWHKGNFDLAQSTLHCCGVSNYTDWVQVHRSIPLSCCVNPDDCITANYSHVYQTGCYKVITEYVESNMDIIIGIAIGTALFPLLGTVLSCCLASYIKKSKYDAMN